MVFVCALVPCPLVGGRGFGVCMVDASVARAPVLGGGGGGVGCGGVWGKPSAY